MVETSKQGKYGYFSNFVASKPIHPFSTISTQVITIFLSK
jgi:hypothetical protein